MRGGACLSGGRGFENVEVLCAGTGGDDDGDDVGRVVERVVRLGRGGRWANNGR